MENEEGEIVREFMRECDTCVLHQNMKEVLVYLTNLDVKEMERIMTRKLAKQVCTRTSRQNKKVKFINRIVQFSVFF
jgi:DNA phosphorothioation-dependent restriction protein DptG